MSRTAIIGGGISGLSTAQILKNRTHVTVFERGQKPGGLIRCENVEGSLFHTCGGHVFNSKREDVLTWFWNHFNREGDFLKAQRNSVVFTAEGQHIPYPIENHIYMFDSATQYAIQNEWTLIEQDTDYDKGLSQYTDFADFLRRRFGQTLYDMYFLPYNKKVWRCDLSQIPLSWLEGKLPMPTVEEMRHFNKERTEETSFVHSSFWYERKGGSGLIIERLSEGLSIVTNSDICEIRREGNKWIVNGEIFDNVVFCGNIMELPQILRGTDLKGLPKAIETFKYHGTTTVFVEIDRNPYSWIYQPSPLHRSHRIICTGNFSPSNNSSSIPSNRITATIEFTDHISKEDILHDLALMPLHPRYITHCYNKYTYPVQSQESRNVVKAVKELLLPQGFIITGRFADWEYYNMDAAIGAAMDALRTER